jgi:hypothetical protein
LLIPSLHQDKLLLILARKAAKSEEYRPSSQCNQSDGLIQQEMEIAEI